MEKNNKDNKDDLKNVFNQKGSKLKNDYKEKQANDKKKKKKKKVLIYIGSFIAFLIIVSISIFGYMNLNNKENKRNENSNISSSTVSSSDSDSTSSSDSYQEVDDNELLESAEAPIQLEKWTKIPYATQINDDTRKSTMKENAIAYAQLTPFINASGNMPSEENGYTSDVTKALNDDGTPNENYSYQTKENLEYNFGIYTQRLLNPVFGNWNSLVADSEREYAFPEEIFKDMFTEDWWNANISEEDHSKLPIYVDWNNDNFGGLELDSPWFGVITGLSASGEAEEDGSGMRVDIDIDVEFTATDTNGKKITRTGLLHLQMVPNKENIDPEVRNLINEASLTINQ